MSQYIFSQQGVNPTIYMNTKLEVKKYEKSTDCIPLKKLKKDVTKIAEGSTNPNSMIHNFFNTIVHKYGDGICETYYDGNTPIVSCAYKVDQKAFNKKENLTIQIYPNGEKHKVYYACILAIHHNIMSDTVTQLAKSLKK